MDSKRVARLVAQRWWVVAITVLIGLGVGYGVTQLLTPEYTATTRLFVSATGGTSSTESFQGDQFSQQRTASYAQLLSSEQVSQRVIDTLGLPISAEELSGNVTASIVPRTVLLDVSVTNPNPERAAEIANTLADQFIAFSGPLETPMGQKEPRSTVTIISKAEAPTSPSFPKPTTNLLYGGLGGLAVGLLLATLAALFTRRIRNVDELAATTKAPSFGPVTLVTRNRAQRTKQLSGWSGPEAEGFRRLRVQLEAGDPPPQVLLVASVTPGSAAAEFAADLAVAFAEAGRKTVLIGSDRQFADVAATMSLANDSAGLGEVIAGRVSFNDLPYPTANANLYVMPPGEGDVESKLSSPVVNDFLDEVRKNFERVVLVTAGVNESSGASVLSASSDADLLVVDQALARRTHVARAAAELNAARANILGAVLVAPR